MALLLKSLLGALAVLLISVLAKSRNYYIAGLVPLFPTFALIAHYIVGGERGVAALKATLLFGLASLLPYFIYLLALYWLVDRWRLGPALIGAAVCWTAAAALLVLLWSRQ